MKTKFQAIPAHLSEAEILLINEDFSKNELGRPSPPENHLGINRLASYLQAKNQTVQVLDTTGFDARLDGPEEFAKWLGANLHRYKSIGFYLTSWNITHVTRSILLLKKELSAMPVFFGGPLAVSAPEATLLHFWEKAQLPKMALVQGYGEFALSEALTKLDELETVENLWVCTNGVMKKGKLIRFSEEQLATLPLLSTDFNTFYHEVWKEVLESGELGDWSLPEAFPTHGLDTNQGCVFSCSYCSLPAYGRTVTSHTPQRVAEELEKMAEEMGFFRFTFTNSNLLFIQRDWLVAFLDEIFSRNLHRYITWNAYYHPMTANLLSHDDFVRIKASGCDQIVLGVQTVEPKVAKLFNRPENTEAVVREILEKMERTGLELVIDYITGVPEESDSEIDRFFDFCIENGVEVRDFQLKCYPGTELPMRLKKSNFPNHELIPITGDLAPEIESFALISKQKNDLFAPRAERLRIANRNLERKRALRLGDQEIRTEAEAKQFLADLEKETVIPEKVKQGMKIMIHSMLQPQTTSSTTESPAEMMKTIVLATSNSPPMLLAMQKRLREELGEEKWQMLLKKYHQDT